MSAQSCDQLCPITADRIEEESRAGNQHPSEGTCALIISVHHCQLPVLIHATCQCPLVPHQCHISVPTSAHQCHISVPI
ncbi:unnamed protein product [Staurois parvus]|uniref:Uncharacterized protein n=1 Tax=Staurois parvus TaxID=386267 RepID=A0ABN9E8Y0_9NEOB|nr:unnamed protein product [Staurois parvus]